MKKEKDTKKIIEYIGGYSCLILSSLSDGVFTYIWLGLAVFHFIAATSEIKFYKKKEEHETDTDSKKY